MWDLAAKEHALVVFAEHRYFGESIPNVNGMSQCMSYLSSEEALADYASLANRIRRKWGASGSAIIAFGGSYGGMLAAWMRILYPSAVDGAIAASAPVLGFPLDDCPVDSSARVVSFTASPAAGAAPRYSLPLAIYYLHASCTVLSVESSYSLPVSYIRCADNLKASYVLIADIGSTAEGRELLSTSMGLCTPLQSAKDVTSFLSYLQTPLFDLSEGSYPFPTDYITFALTGSSAPLPPWAMQVMCEYVSADFGVTISGDPKQVLFSVKSGGVTVDVDWDVTTNNGYSMEALSESGALQLATAVAQAIQVWYNVSGTLPACIDWASGSAPNAEKGEEDSGWRTNPLSRYRHQRDVIDRVELSTAVPAESEQDKEICSASVDDVDAMTAWNALVCNEGINLVNWWAQGVGNDLYWPPNQQKGFTLESLVPGSLAYCPYLRAMGLYGIPEKRDEWSVWMDTAYGGTRMQYATNIVFSNGNLDPWAPAGVADMISKDGSVVSVTIDMGGHHLDLFWPTEEDPASVRYTTCPVH